MVIDLRVCRHLDWLGGRVIDYQTSVSLDTWIGAGVLISYQLVCYL